MTELRRNASQAAANMGADQAKTVSDTLQTISPQKKLMEDRMNKVYGTRAVREANPELVQRQRSNFLGGERERADAQQDSIKSFYNTGTHPSSLTLGHFSGGHEIALRQNGYTDIGGLRYTLMPDGIVTIDRRQGY